MYKELKLKNAVFNIIVLCCYVSCGIILMCSFGIVFTYIAENARDFRTVYKVEAILLAIIWGIGVITMPFCKNIIITEKSISVYLWKNKLWEINKDEIVECIYTRAAWYKFLFPLESFNMFALQFKLTDKKISRKYLNLSYKQVKKIQQNFSYPIKIIY